MKILFSIIIFCVLVVLVYTYNIYNTIYTQQSDERVNPENLNDDTFRGLDYSGCSQQRQC